MEEIVKKNRKGRPKKNKLVEQAKIVIEDLLKPVEQPVLTFDEVVSIESEVIKENDVIIEEVEKQIEVLKSPKPKEWDFTIDDLIEYFDPDLSYELSGYKPITTTKGLDFNPDWFTETRDTYLKTGHYCKYPKRTKAFNEFWDKQYKRCREGMTVNGYTVTGDHYFFLNFYQLDDLTSASKAGGGRIRSFPKFFAEQYKYFHYLELCKRLRKNCVLMKARGVG